MPFLRSPAPAPSPTPGKRDRAPLRGNAFPRRTVPKPVEHTSGRHPRHGRRQACRRTRPGDARVMSRTLFTMSNDRAGERHGTRSFPRRKPGPRRCARRWPPPPATPSVATLGSHVRPQRPHPGPKTRERMVGLGRLERPTSRLSGVRSNQLSYRPAAPAARTPKGDGPPADGAGRDGQTAAPGAPPPRLCRGVLGHAAAMPQRCWPHRGVLGHAAALLTTPRRFWPRRGARSSRGRIPDPLERR